MWTFSTSHIGKPRQRRELPRMRWDGVRIFSSRWKFWIRLGKLTSQCSQTKVSSEEVVELAAWWSFYLENFCASWDKAHWPKWYFSLFSFAALVFLKWVFLAGVSVGVVCCDHVLKTCLQEKSIKINKASLWWRYEDKDEDETELSSTRAVSFFPGHPRAWRLVPSNSAEVKDVVIPEDTLLFLKAEMFSLHGMLSVSPFNEKTGHIEMNHDVSKETILMCLFFRSCFEAPKYP